MSLEYQEHYTHSRRGDLEAQAEVEEARKGAQMKQRKPDRFDEIVKARMEQDGGLWSDGAADLLRKEHAWMRMMVKKVDAWACQELADNDDVIAEILKQLDQRRK